MSRRGDWAAGVLGLAMLSVLITRRNTGTAEIINAAAKGLADSIKVATAGEVQPEPEPEWHKECKWCWRTIWHTPENYTGELIGGWPSDGIR
jgi:hypothetical protein